MRKRLLFIPLIIMGFSYVSWSNDIDAVVSWKKKKLFFFSSTQYIKYDIKKGNSDIGYPRSINKITWPGLWQDGVDAGINRGNGKLYFFKGSEYIRYDEKNDKADPGYPKIISGNWPGIWRDGIDAAVHWGNGKAFFFKGREYIRFDLKKLKADPGYPKDIASGWPGLWAEGIEAAVNRGNGKAYFYKGNTYIRFDINAGKADKGYPKTIRSDNWPGIKFNFRFTLSTLGQKGIKPHLKPNYGFPVSRQYQRGCFAFAVNHILEYKYKLKINLKEAEKRINKPREDLWTSTHIQNFITAYNIELNWYKDVKTFFQFLSQGEPLMIQYRWYSSETRWVGHFVAVYSFDENGVWISDSISVKRIHLPYDDLLDPSGMSTLYSFALVQKK